MSEIIPVDHVVKLQVTDESVIGDISDLIYYADHFYILDRLQAKIFMFHKDGSFVKMIGNKGQGPGEYSDPATIRRCFDGNIAILDGLQGRVLVYSQWGDYYSSTPERIIDKSERILPQKCFIWDEEERLYFAAIQAREKKIPWHVLLNTDFQVVRRFGEREDILFQAGMNSWGFTAFEKVGATIWAGSPYDNTIDVYDLEGRLLGDIGAAPTFKTLTHDMLAAAARKKDIKELRRMLVKTDHTLDIIASGRVVFVFSPTQYDLFDTHGNLLRSGLKRDKIRALLDAHNDYVYSEILPFNTTKNYNRDDYEALRKAGFDLADNDNDNPYIRVGKLVK